ncbi:MAG: hypothetical protein ACLFRG_03525 [Desulfococcaceae bacterium]
MLKRKSRTTQQWPWGLLLILLLVSVGKAAANAPILIAHPDAPVDSLERREVRDIFLGEMSLWPNQERIAFATLKARQVHETFLGEYVGRTSSQYDIFWKKKVFSGQGRMPKSMDSPEAVIEFVANTPGAIGYLPSGTSPGNAKVIPVK